MPSGSLAHKGDIIGLAFVIALLFVWLTTVIIWMDRRLDRLEVVTEPIRQEMASDSAR